MSSRAYAPRRAGKRWQEQAPEYVLDCFDDGPDRFHDRYTVLLGGSMYEPSLNRGCMYLGLNEGGGSYFGELDFAAPYRYHAGHKRVRWLDLPEAVRCAVIARVTTE